VVDETTRLVTIGCITGVFGVRGWVKVRSYTEPRENILGYSRWLVRRDGHWRPMELVEGRLQGKGVVASLEGVHDREQALGLMGADIALPREDLPPLPEGEYYWADLEGLEVVTTQGVSLGHVDHLLATGANDVLVVIGERERMIPMAAPYVTHVDLERGRIEVDWDPEF